MRNTILIFVYFTVLVTILAKTGTLKKKKICFVQPNKEYCTIQSIQINPESNAPDIQKLLEIHGGNHYQNIIEEINITNGSYYETPTIYGTSTTKTQDDDAITDRVKEDDQQMQVVKEKCNDYQYIATVGSCYKISLDLKIWAEAFETCQLEDSHLVVLNSKTEHEAVLNLLKMIPDRDEWTYFSAGFRDPGYDLEIKANVFNTIFGETLEEAGYSEWAEGEPNYYQNSEYCGSIYKYDGKLNDVLCTYGLPYICEKEIHT